MSLLQLGMSLSRTQIMAAVLDAEGRQSRIERLATPTGYAALLDALTQLADRADPTRALPFGLAIPGSIAPRSGRVRNCNLPFLNGRDLHPDLESATGRPVRLANDADCLALSEARDGAGARGRVVFGVILGDGVGGGVMIDGLPLTGADGSGGEWGHSPLPWPRPDEVPGPRCWCGLEGCMEQWVSIPALEREHQRLAHFARPIRLAEIVRQANDGAAAARSALEDYINRLGRGLAALCNLIDPDVIVLGGEGAELGLLYDQLQGAIAPYAISDGSAAVIVKAAHGDASIARGAAWLWPGTALARA